MWKVLFYLSNFACIGCFTQRLYERPICTLPVPVRGQCQTCLYCYSRQKPNWAKMSCNMRYKMNVMVLIMYFYVFFTLLIITHNKRSHQVIIKQRISKETDVISMESDTVETTEGTPAGEQQCSRKDHVVYIKTHKTGSTTTAHIFWR